MDETSRLLPRDEFTTNHKQEIRWLVKSAVPVSATYALQLTFTTVSLWAVGQLGKEELASMSLCIVLVAVCGYGIFQGSATAIDTLAAQAYGRKDYRMVGVITQRCCIYMMCVGVLVAVVYSFPSKLIQIVGPERKIAEMTVMLMRTMVFDIPGYILFECSKHYFQVQGLFRAGTVILMICSPTNLVLNYFLVLHPTTGMGLPGAPLAIIFTDLIAVTLSVGYAVFFTDLRCWPGLSMQMFRGWNELVKLAVPGAIMYEAEWVAFEVITLASSRFGTTTMAAQSIVGNICTLAFQVPMSFGLAASTRVGNLIGAGSVQAVKLATRVSLYASSCTALFNFTAILLLRYQIGSFFSNDDDVVATVARICVVAAIFQLSDSLNCVTGGILRGQGRQSVSSVLNMVSYYCFGVPLGFVLAFGYKFELMGLWIGLVLGLSTLAVIQLVVICRTNWPKMIEAARAKAEV